MSSLSQSLAQSLAQSLSTSLSNSMPFTTEWTLAGDAAARTITLPLVQNRAEGALSYNCVVDWGDGTTPSVVTSYNDANRIHTYSSDGTYQVKITGTMEGWSFNNGGDKSKITKVIHWGDASVFDGFKYLKGGFHGCTNLSQAGTGPISASGSGLGSDGFNNTFRDTGVASIPSKLFSQHTLVDTFRSCFRGSALVSFPTGTFDNNTAVTDLYQLCVNASAFTTIPSGLFDNLVLLSDAQSIFQNTAIVSIPSGLFDNNTAISTFANAFEDCASLASIPSGLFDNNTAVTSFASTFRATSIASIPSGLFDNNTAITDLASCFRSCSSLETTPSELFRFNTSCVDFSYTFYGCIDHQENIDLFYASGEESTRFLNQDVDFTSCFERDSFTGTQGTAPDLWNCSFGTGTPTTTDCWAGAGNSASSLTNYGSIPGGWL